EFQSAGRDVTRRHVAEEALQASQANLAALMNNSVDSIFSMDADRRLITFNAAFEKRCKESFGVQLKPGMRLRDYIPADVLSRWGEWINRALAGEHFSVDYKYRLDGNPRYSDINFNPIVTPNGEITGVAVFSRDVTERKIAEAALQISEANLS